MTKKWNLDFVVTTRSHSCCPLPWKAIPLPLGWMESSRRQWLPYDLILVHWGPTYDFFQHHFFQALIFMSNRHHTSTYHKISIKDFFPRIPKLPSDLKLVHWGLSYEFFKHHFFQALIFTSNRCRTSTYYKISIKDFFPRIPKLPSGLKLVH